MDKKFDLLSSKKDYISAPVARDHEMAHVLSRLTDILSVSETDVIFGTVSKDSDPIIDAIQRLLEDSAPILVRRVLIPGDERTAEIFDIRDMLKDKSYLQSCLDFRMDNMVPESGMSVKEIVDRLGTMTDVPKNLDQMEEELVDESSDEEDDN